MPFRKNQPYNDLPLLPPDRKKIETIPILKQESKSAVALAELKGLAKTLPNPQILINGIVLKEAKASSEIENVITTHDKLYQALTLKNPTVDKDTKEVLRYREALFAGQKYLEQKGFLNTTGIVKIQEALVENNTGIRKLPGTALQNDVTGEVIYTPPDSQRVLQQLMQNLDEFLNASDDGIPPLIKMAIQHYQFESIHPFYDGNGRTGRILNTLYLFMNGLLDSPILYLSGFIIQHKSTYYRLLQEVRTADKWEEWILFMLRGVEQTSLETIKKINRILALFEEAIETAKEKAPKIYSKELIELLFMHPYSKIEYVVEHLGVERRTASRYLKELEKAGILRSETKWKEIIFINSRLYELLRK